MQFNAVPSTITCDPTMHKRARRARNCLPCSLMSLRELLLAMYFRFLTKTAVGAAFYSHAVDESWRCSLASCRGDCWRLILASCRGDCWRLILASRRRRLLALQFNVMSRKTWRCNLVSWEENCCRSVVVIDARRRTHRGFVIKTQRQNANWSRSAGLSLGWSWALNGHQLSKE